MARVTAAEVIQITDIDSSVDLTKFILTATTLVDNVLVGHGLDSTTLELIELWLAAHFAKILELHPAGEKIGAVSLDYQWKVGLNLQVTMYGQQALILDTTGRLGTLSEKGALPSFDFKDISDY